jgi:hypothetical protein
MKSTQAWGWLAAGVLAAGLNAAYHNGGFAWAHRIADQAQHVSGAVVALASGHAEQFLAEAETLTARNDGEMTAFSDEAVAKADQQMARLEAVYARAEAVQAREQAHCARIRAERARIEQRIAARQRFVRVPSVQFETAAMQIPDAPVFRTPRIASSQIRTAHCSHLRISLPALPKVGVPATPAVNVSFSTEADD